MTMLQSTGKVYTFDMNKNKFTNNNIPTIPIPGTDGYVTFYKDTIYYSLHLIYHSFENTHSNIKYYIKYMEKIY